MIKLVCSIYWSYNYWNPSTLQWQVLEAKLHLGAKKWKLKMQKCYNENQNNKLSLYSKNMELHNQLNHDNK